MPPSPQKKAEKLLARAIARGGITTREAVAAGFSRDMLFRLARRGDLRRVAQGVYSPADASGITEHQTMVEVVRRCPQAMVCLLSALAFHEIGTELPHEVWIGLPRGTRPPRGLPARVVYFSAKGLQDGVETRMIQGVAVPVTGPARTVVDCFRHRRQMGPETCIEALRDVLRKRLATPAEISDLAKRHRIFTVMRPYIEAMI